MRLIAGLLICVGVAAADCTVGDFDYCYELTIPAVPSTPSGFHVLHFSTDYVGITGNMASFRTAIASAAGKVRADGYDIQFFTSGDAAIPTCRVAYDNADGDGWWGLRVATGTTTIQARIGKAAASDASDCTSSTGAFRDYDLVLLNGATTDYSGNSRYGSFVGGLSTAAGKFGLAYDLDGSADYLLTTGLNANTDTSQCIALLVRTDNAISGTGTGERIWSWESGTGAYQNMRATWGTSGPVAKIQYQAGANDYSTWTTTPRSAETWSFVTSGVRTTTSSHTWTDGAESDTDTPDNALANRSQALTVGARYEGSNPFNGLVNLFYLSLGGTTDAYTQGCSLVENDYDYDTFFTPGTVFTMSAETVGSSFVYPPVVVWFQAAAAASGSSSQLVAAAATTASSVCASGNSDDPTLVGDAVDCFGAGLDTILGGVR